MLDGTSIERRARIPVQFCYPPSCINVVLQQVQYSKHARCTASIESVRLQEVRNRSVILKVFTERLMPGENLGSSVKVRRQEAGCAIKNSEGRFTR